MTEPFRLDPTVERHAETLQRLETEELAWLGSNGRNGYPHSVPVWFLWHDGAAVSFSQPTAAKVKNFRADAKALFHFEAGEDGEQVHILQGEVDLPDESSADWLEARGLRDVYLAKYAQGLANLGWSADVMFADFSSVIVFRPHKLLAF
jgi:PPOX class probable F420-dependent enzyme